MSATPYRILIVDDSAEDRHAFRRYLAQGREAAFIVSEAATGAEGLQRCKDGSPDCILLDYNLPDLNGIDFLKQLNQSQPESTPAVVMLTGHGNETIAVNAMKAGAQDYLVKGFAESGFARAIHNAIENVILRRAVAEQANAVNKLARERASMAEELAARAADLAEADRRKDEFLATLAHELRNPLAPISNSINLLLQADLDEATVRELYEVMRRQTSHMVRLVDDLMEISRITRNKVELRLKAVDLNSVIRNALETSEPLFKAAGHEFSVALAQEPIWLEADEVRLAQVFSNLLNNAAKYTEKGGRIHLSVERVGDHATVSVRDTGIGIEAEMLPKVFDIFTQVESPLGRAHGGLGIGLTLANRLTALHAGTLQVKSDGLGKGSEFIVTLPVARPAQVPLPDRESSRAPAANEPIALPPKHRVLVVDDNVDSAESLGLLLSALGSATCIANDGKTALAVLHTFRPDVIVLDIGMPGMNGYEVAAEIRKLPEFRGTLVVALTGWGQTEDIKNAHAAGIDRHLVKPVELSTLQTLLSF